MRGVAEDALDLLYYSSALDEGHSANDRFQGGSGERGYSSGVQGGSGCLCLRRDLCGNVDKAEDPCGYLFQVSSLLYRQAEDSGCRRKGREVQEEVRQEVVCSRPLWRRPSAPTLAEETFRQDLVRGRGAELPGGSCSDDQAAAAGPSITTIFVTSPRSWLKETHRRYTYRLIGPLAQEGWPSG